MQTLSNALRYDGWLYITVFVALVIFFTFFYTSLQFNPVDVADNLKKQNASIPGIRPGKRTAEYIDFILTRLTFAGAFYIAAVCVLPTFLQTKFNVPFYYGGTSLLIVVGVALDNRSADRKPPRHTQLRRIRGTRRAAYPRASRVATPITFETPGGGSQWASDRGFRLPKH